VKSSLTIGGKKLWDNTQCPAVTPKIRSLPPWDCSKGVGETKRLEDGTKTHQLELRSTRVQERNDQGKGGGDSPHETDEEEEGRLAKENKAR